MSDVVFDVAAGTVEYFVEHRGEASGPKFGKPCEVYDARRRIWRQLDTCQLQTYLTADVPRVECAEYEVSRAATSWAEPVSRFTGPLEAAVIDRLQEASFSAMARRLGLTWDEIDAHFAAVPAESREAVDVVAMDMRRPYMDASAKWLPNARVCFDRCHLARHLGDAVNTVRKEEHARLRTDGDGTHLHDLFITGILNAVILRTTDAAAQSMHARIQRI